MFLSFVYGENGFGECFKGCFSFVCFLREKKAGVFSHGLSESIFLIQSRLVFVLLHSLLTALSIHFRTC